MATDQVPPNMPKVPAPAPASAPPVPGAKPPLPPAPRPPVVAKTNDPTQADEEQHGPHVELNFWQLPWVQNILPFVTSFAFHAGLILLGLIFYAGYHYVAQMKPHQDEVIIPDAAMINDGPPGGVPFQGLGGDPNRQAMQDKDPTSKTEEWADKKSSNLEMKAAGGADGDTDDTTIGVSAVGGGMGHGKGGHGSGKGDFSGSGDGDGGGALAMFGTPGGGGIGPKGPVFGHGGNAKRIAFVCDASGSMLTKFSTLRRELSNTVQGLRLIQSFNIIFFQEQTATALDANQLLIATPENKLKATNFLEDKVTPRGETNPLPGIEIAFRQHPELIYILTDGDFPDNEAVLKKVRELNKDKKVKVNTIAFVGEADTDTDFMKLLKQIADENGGTYKFVKESDL
jgi:hypothetical protein